MLAHASRGHGHSPSAEPIPKFARLTPEVIEATMQGLSSAIHGDARDAAAAVLRRLRTIVDECVPAHPSGPHQLGALPDIIGTVVTLQYPLIELERFLSDEQS